MISKTEVNYEKPATIRTYQFMSNIQISNYCACFIDLLGQKSALEGEGLLPIFADSNEEGSFNKKIHKSVGVIDRLQKDASFFMGDVPEISIRDDLSSSDQVSYDEMKTSKMKQQRWSDGLVFYTTMQGPAPMNAIWDILGSAGSLCLLGLAEENPLRGGVEISWGAELHDNELYGAIVANSYKLESEVAKYPRIVVGKYMIEYLTLASSYKGSDYVEIYNRDLAVLCLDMISTDIDGNFILNYVGVSFVEYCLKDNAEYFYEKAYNFSVKQRDKFSSEKNFKLARRYDWLVNYLVINGRNIIDFQISNEEVVWHKAQAKDGHVIWPFNYTFDLTRVNCPRCLELIKLEHKSRV